LLIGRLTISNGVVVFIVVGGEVQLVFNRHLRPAMTGVHPPRRRRQRPGPRRRSADPVPRSQRRRSSPPPSAAASAAAARLPRVDLDVDHVQPAIRPDGGDRDDLDEARPEIARLLFGAERRRRFVTDAADTDAACRRRRSGSGACRLRSLADRSPQNTQARNQSIEIKEVPK